MVHAIDTNKAKYEGLLSSLQNCYDIVKANRNELTPEEEAPAEAAEEVSTDAAQENSMLLVVQITNQSSCKKCCQHGI